MLTSRRKVFLLVALAVIAVDAISKEIALHALAGQRIVNLFGDHFHLELYRNHAGPGNLLQGHPVLVSLLSIVAVSLICALGWRATTRAYAVAFGLLLGGGIGNLLDRIFAGPGPLRGGVIDWIKPTLSGGSMNLADVSIDAAIIALLVAVLLDWRRPAAASLSSPSTKS